MHMLNFSGKIALVTGASSGIGKTTALTLGKLGAKVGIAARRIEILEELASEADKQGYTLFPIPMDVTKKEQVEQGIDLLIQQFGSLDILINNAGIVKESPLAETPDSSWDLVMDTNVKGFFLTSRKAAEVMTKQRYGRIINVASMLTGGVGTADKDIASYVSSKAGVIGLTAALANELASVGILVNAIGPGYVDTEINADIKQNPQLFQQTIKRIPLKRFATPQEIANVIAFLASQENSYMTGSTIYVDGGWLVG